MNKEIYLNPKIFSDPEKIEKVSIHQGFEEGLLMAGDNDKRVVALCSDSVESKKCLFAKEYPERFFKDGIAEQSMFLVAFGMAAMGKIPFILLPMLFSLGKNWEQIRAAMYYNNVPVKIIGSYTGVSAGLSGKGTMQLMEDITLMRGIPGVTILSPCDAIEAQKATIYAAQISSPVYIRFPQEETLIITTNETPFEIGKAEIFFRPDGDADVGVIAAGPLVYNAIRAAKELDNEGVRVRVLNLSTIKPIDIDAVVKLAQQTGKIVTIEEHQTSGGVGSAVSEILAQILPAKIRFVGARDMFGQSGTREELIAHYGMDIENIKNIIREINES